MSFNDIKQEPNIIIESFYLIVVFKSIVINLKFFAEPSIPVCFIWESPPPRVPDSHKYANYRLAISLCRAFICANLFCFPSEAPGSPTFTVDIEATSITVNWTKPADDGGSPITACRVLILRGNTKIQNRNITDLTAMQLDIGGLTKSTNYSINLFARNYVFEGNAAERKIQTKYEGMKVCTKNALRVHKYCIQSVDLFI